MKTTDVSVLHAIIWSLTSNFTASQRHFHQLDVCTSGTSYICSGLTQRSPTFLTPGTGFVEDGFSTDRVGGGVGDGSGGNASDGEQKMRFRSLARRSPPAVRPGS